VEEELLKFDASGNLDSVVKGAKEKRTLGGKHHHHHHNAQERFEVPDLDQTSIVSGSVRDSQVTG
jgi:hypothetical protein